MARIAGVNIPSNKRVEIALTYIHGIGPTTAKQIIGKLGIAPERRVQDLTDQEVLHIREEIDANQTVEGDLRRETAMCASASPHSRSLPVSEHPLRSCSASARGSLSLSADRFPTSCSHS